MSKKANIALIGLMGAGKTTVGKVLSEKLYFKLIDIDEIIESNEGKKISELFESYGECYFRNLEVKTIEFYSKLNNQIISTGGGAVENKINIQNLLENSLVFYLYAPVKTICERLTNEIFNRPLLHTVNPEDKIYELLTKREPYYLLANYKIDTTNKNINDIVQEIVKIYSETNNGS